MSGATKQVNMNNDVHFIKYFGHASVFCIEQYARRIKLYIKGRLQISSSIIYTKKWRTNAQYLYVSTSDRLIHLIFAKSAAFELKHGSAKPALDTSQA